MSGTVPIEELPAQMVFDEEYFLENGTETVGGEEVPLITFNAPSIGEWLQTLPGYAADKMLLGNLTWADVPDGGMDMVTPDTPTGPVVNDGAKTFDWTYSDGYTSIGDYEYTTNSGITYSQVTVKPQTIPNADFDVGEVGVRVKAAPGRYVSSTLFSTAEYLYVDSDGTVALNSWPVVYKSMRQESIDLNTLLYDISVSGFNDTSGSAQSNYKVPATGVSIVQFSAVGNAEINGTGRIGYRFTNAMPDNPYNDFEYFIRIFRDGGGTKISTKNNGSDVTLSTSLNFNNIKLRLRTDADFIYHEYSTDGGDNWTLKASPVARTGVELFLVAMVEPNEVLFDIRQSGLIPA